MRLARVWLLLGLVGLTAQAADTRVSIRVQEDGHVITCTVPRRAENRTLYVGVVGHLSSERQLDGDWAPLTHQLRLRDLVPCEGEPLVVAFCEVLYVPHHSQIATTNMPCRQ